MQQTAEARLKAHLFNATIGIATEKERAMHLPSMIKYIRDLDPDEIFSYPPTTGIPELRNKWAQRQMEENPSLGNKQVSLPIVTNGITHGLSIIADLFCEKGDPVILPDKLWGNYRMIFGLRRGGDILTYPFYNNAGGFNLESLKSLLGTIPISKKVIIIFNFPNNPTGYSPRVDEAVAIAEMLYREAESGRKLIVVLDDAYFGFFYEDEIIRESLFSALADLHPQILALKVDGATKEDYAWGLRVGFLTMGIGGTGEKSILYQCMEKKVGGDIRATISYSSMLSQSLLLKTMLSPHLKEEKSQKYNILRARYLKVKDALRNEKYKGCWRYYPFNSGYFMCLELKDADANSVRKRLLNNYGVGVIATGASDLRIAFSCIEQDQVHELFELLYNAVEDIRKTT